MSGGGEGATEAGRSRIWVRGGECGGGVSAKWVSVGPWKRDAAGVEREAEAAEGRVEGAKKTICEEDERMWEERKR